jgi:hypothetical protein
MKIKFLETASVAKLFPPIPAKKLLPDWYKDLTIDTVPGQKQPWTSLSSVKRCVPVLDYMTSGYIIRNHVDLLVARTWDDRRGEQVLFEYKKTELNIPAVTYHDPKQMPLIRNGHQKTVAKFTGMWGIETPPGYSCLFYQPHYFNETRFNILPGIVDTDQFSNPINFPFIMSDSKENENFVIEAGTPLVCVLPFKREDWTHELGKWDPDSNCATYMKTIWENIYKKFMHSKKNFN